MQRTGTLYLIPSLIADNPYEQAFPASNRSTLETIDFFLVEELRTARRFIGGYHLQQSISDLTFFQVNKSTTMAEVTAYFKEIPPDKNIGIISEAGCPGIADPGAVAVKYAHEIGMTVRPLVGPSSILLALMGSGFSGQSFIFHGYLPIDKEARKKQIGAMELDSKKNKRTQIFMETPYRNNAVLSDLIHTCDPETLVCIAANVMGVQESIRTHKIGFWKTNLPDLHKQPVIFLLYI